MSHKQKQTKKSVDNGDWTAVNGTANTSDLFFNCVEDVARILRYHRLSDSAHDTALLIVAKLAHTHGLAPKRRRQTGASA